jgi:hypothetical protein
LKNSLSGQNPPLVLPRNNAPNHNSYFKGKKRNRSRINGCWNAMGVQFILAPWLQPTNQDSQTSVNFRRTRRYAFSVGETARRAAATAAARLHERINFVGRPLHSGAHLPHSGAHPVPAGRAIYRRRHCGRFPLRAVRRRRGVEPLLSSRSARSARRRWGLCLCRLCEWRAVAVPVLRGPLRPHLPRLWCQSQVEPVPGHSWHDPCGTRCCCCCYILCRSVARVL